MGKMNRSLILQYLCFLLLLIEGTCQKCSPPSGSSCIPIWKKPPIASCITKVENGTSLTWFEMQENCAKHSGRLVWLRDDFNTLNLLSTEKLNNATNFLLIGLLHSMQGDELNFWSSPNDNSTLSCGTEDTALCMPSSATEKQCNIIGCCWLHGKCQYPERQWLPAKNGNDPVDTSTISGTSKRSCVGLQKSGKNWTFKAFDCSMTSAANTGYVCEYKCMPDWATMSLKNVTWPRISSTGGSSTAAGRNRSGKVFNNQTMLTIFGVALLLIMCEVAFSITL